MSILKCVLAIGVGFVLVGSVSAAGVVNPHVTTDTSVDFHTVDSILADIVTPAMTDEQKILAVFNTVRRMMVHGPCPKDLAFDFHKVMNVLGTGSCLRQTTPLAVLLDRLGYKSRSWVHDGHHMMEVYYGGGWHCIDPHMTFYVYDRSTPRQIASVAQLQGDPSLAFKAVEEGRAGKGFLLCGDSPKWFAGKEGDWHIEFNGGWPPMTIDQRFGAITLRRGETYVRTWFPGEHWYKQGWPTKDGCGPIHHCSKRDQKDEVNWPLYEPHAWDGPASTYYRCHGVGRLEYEPGFDSGTYRDAVVSQKNVHVVKTGGMPRLAQVDPSQPGEIVFSVACPYVMTAVDLGLRGDIQALPKVAVSTDAGKTWESPSGFIGQGPPDAMGLTGSWRDPVNGGWDGYLLRFRFTDGETVGGVRLITHFQLNRYSLPNFVPGKNVVSVQADRFEYPLTVTYNWAEGSDWSSKRAISKTFDRTGQFEVDVAGPKYPRMESLVLSVAP